MLSEEERQEAALHREPLYCGRADWQHRPLLELCREQMQEAEAQGNHQRLAYLRDRERQLTRKKPVFNKAAFKTLLTDLKEAGIEIPTPDMWPQRYSKPDSHAAAAMIMLLKKGDTYWLKRLLDTGVDPNEYLYENDRDIPLCMAPYWNPNMIPLLLEYGADPSGDGEGCIPLLRAHDREKNQWVYRLMEAGANPFVESDTGCHLLSLAVTSKDIDLVRHLLQLGVNPNGDEDGEWMPLHHAALSGDVALARILMDAGASPFRIVLDSIVGAATGESPLYAAEERLFISADGKTAEDRREHKHARRLLGSIYSRFPDIDYLPYPGFHSDENIDRTAYFNASLWNTAAYGLTLDTGYLLRYFGADPNACNRAGIPALVIAAVRGHTETVYELLCYGATPELPPHLLTAAGCTGEVNEEIVQLIRRFKGA